ncbi:unnamed protein product [Rotaria socialis]|uniref:NAD(P)(+)--arginine ADP-ribosyltransferase n=1 Tax=Rotaria socialis TaxID=392032 RepID=A0A821FXW5_9BILA|nr:unnamed protein product [Rotaria socialis]
MDTIPDSGKRFIGILNDPNLMCMPISGYQECPLLSLEESIQPLKSILSDIETYAHASKVLCDNPPADGLTRDESASIRLYSMEWYPTDKCLYVTLNETLRSADRNKLKPWFPYLKLILTALKKVPSFYGTVYRGVKLDLTKEYFQGKLFTWWGFSSCTTSVAVLQNDGFLGKTGLRTIFSIETNSAVHIKNHTYFPMEEEVLLPPAIQFKVVSILDTGNGLNMIQLKETSPLFPDLALPSPKKVSSMSQISNQSSHVVTGSFVQPNTE